MSRNDAVIKETFCLHPPASTARMSPPGSSFTVKASNGEEYLMDGLVMYPCASIIQRDPNVFGDTADDWVPERWLGEAANSIPSSAWRLFERGPRNCIGLELANLESRIIVAIVARKYDFIKTGLGQSALDDHGLPVLNSKGQYQTRRMTSKPVDGTTMKVKLAIEA
ncbi:cytochrome P450 [Xylaria venustula]|nr:cytochrome P450 [Xylaria venustula]